MSDKQPGSRLPALLRPWLVVCTLPATGLSAYRLIGNSAIALGIAILAEFLVLISGLATGVWQQLEGKWVERLADWTDTKVSALLSNYTKLYLEFMNYKHREFDVRGLTTQGIFTLELNKVFVELKFAPQQSNLISANPIGIIQDVELQGNHPIYHFLGSEQLSSQNIVIIGPPGSGKTTMLKHLTLLLTHRNKLNQVVGYRRISGIKDCIPILLFLREHSDSISKSPNLSLLQIIKESLVASQAPPAPVGWFETRLDKGQCLVMLDGLDEVARSEERKIIVRWVEKQMVAYGRNRFLVTSRPFGYRSNPLSGMTVLEVRPFNQRQVREFVFGWYYTNEIMSMQMEDMGVRMKANTGARDLLKRLESAPALFDLAANPLLLTMITTVHRYRSTLPGRRVDLYAEIFEVFLGKRKEAVGIISDLTPTQKLLVLQPLAYFMMCNQQRSITKEDAGKSIQESLARVDPLTSSDVFLQMIENSSGVLLEQESGSYSFAHQTFQEYLSAAHVRERGLVDDLVQHIEEPWWQEVIRLYVALSDATKVVSSCIKLDDPSISAIILALDCLEEAREINNELRIQFDDMLARWSSHGDRERRIVMAEALLAIRARKMTYIDANHAVDNSLITGSEYQLFLEEQRDLGIYLQPDSWNQYSHHAGAGSQPITDVRSSDANEFCSWLTRRTSNDWEYRLPRLDEAGPVNDIHAHPGYWIYDTKHNITMMPGKDRNWIEKDLVDSLVSSDITRGMTIFLNTQLDYIDSDIRLPVIKNLDMHTIFGDKIISFLDLPGTLHLFFNLLSKYYAEEGNWGILLSESNIWSRLRKYYPVKEAKRQRLYYPLITMKEISQLSADIPNLDRFALLSNASTSISYRSVESELTASIKFGFIPHIAEIKFSVSGYKRKLCKYAFDNQSHPDHMTKGSKLRHLRELVGHEIDISLEDGYSQILPYQDCVNTMLNRNLEEITLVGSNESSRDAKRFVLWSLRMHLLGIVARMSMRRLISNPALPVTAPPKVVFPPLGEDHGMDLLAAASTLYIQLCILEQHTQGRHSSGGAIRLARERPSDNL